MATTRELAMLLRTATIALALVVNAGGLVLSAEKDSLAAAAGIEFFEKRIRPLLVEHCHQCHGPKQQRSGLLLSSLSGMLQGGDRGPAIVPGQPEKSLLLEAVRYSDDDLKMPPKGKLKAEQIADLSRWIELGAPGPAQEVAAGPTPADAFDLAERRKHWAYQPLSAGALPMVKGADWCRSPIDFFVLARLEAAGLVPAQATENRTLIRRVTFDLTGLPPTPEEVEDFCQSAIRIPHSKPW